MAWELPQSPVNGHRAINRYRQTIAAIPDDGPGAEILREMALNRLEELRLMRPYGQTRRRSRP